MIVIKTLYTLNVQRIVNSFTKDKYAIHFIF